MAADFATNMVMAAAAQLKVHATSASTHPLRVVGVSVTEVTFSNPAEAEKFAAWCMSEGQPAKVVDFAPEPTVAVLH